MERKQIENYNYWIDEYGNVYNSKGFALRGHLSNKGYLMHKLFISKNEKRKWIYPHRYVALYWVDNPENKPQVDHIDGNKLNNHYTNLEWVTNQENRDRAVNLRLHVHGEKHGNSKLTTEQVLEIKSSTKSDYQLSKIYKVNSGTIWKIRNNQRWKHL